MLLASNGSRLHPICFIRVVVKLKQYMYIYDVKDLVPVFSKLHRRWERVEKGGGAKFIIKHVDSLTS